MTKSVEKQVEKAVSNSISSQFENPVVVETIAKSLSRSVHPIVEEMLRQTFANTLVPGMQRAVTVMFEQVHAVLMEGLKDAFKSQTPHITALTNLQVTLDSLTRQLQTATTNLSSTLKLEDSLKKFSQDLQQQISNTLQMELQKGNLSVTNNEGPGHMRRSSSSASSISTAAGTSSANAESKRQIDRALESRDYDGAFIVALGHHDLSMMLRLITKLKPKTVFVSPNNCLLSQPVVLSLIHQLTVDLKKEVNLKLSWLQEALLALQTNDPLIVDHYPRVLAIVKTRLDELNETLMETDPSSASTRTLYIVLRVLQGMMG